MCDFCDNAKKMQTRWGEYGSMYTGPLAGTCGGLVVSGASYSGNTAYSTLEATVESLLKIEANARSMRMTIMITTILTKYGPNSSKALEMAGWTKGTDYSTRYGVSKVGTMEMWFKTLEYDTSY